MPFIAVNVSGKATSAQKEEIKSSLGKVITLIPGKIEERLMIDISDNHALYMGGRELSHGAFVDVRLYKSAEFADKQKLAIEISGILNRVLDIPPEDIYLNYIEFETWGAKGTLK